MVLPVHMLIYEKVCFEFEKTKDTFLNILSASNREHEKVTECSILEENYTSASGAPLISLASR